MVRLAGGLVLMAALLSGVFADSGDYVTCLSGSLPVMMSAPHGGALRPDHIPQRDAGCYVEGSCVWSHDCGAKDFFRCYAIVEPDDATRLLILLVRDKLHELTGRYPHVVINELHRTKLDANRDLYEAAFGVPEVEAAWTDFHRCIFQAQSEFEVGLYLDMHGQSHPEQRAELGYLVQGSVLDADDVMTADDDITPGNTSLRALGERATKRGVVFSEVLRGYSSFGGLLQEHGYEAVPSPRYPGPGGAQYFSGNYNTRRHGSLTEGTVDGIQVESARSVRKPDQRDQYAEALARTIIDFLRIHYDIDVMTDDVTDTVLAAPPGGSTGERAGGIPAMYLHVVVLVVPVILELFIE